MKQPAVYMMTNQRNGTIYICVTSHLVQRAFQHKQGLSEGFTKRYDCKQLVYYELFDNMEAAITREKQLKAGSRQKKIKLIEKQNTDWMDLYVSICC